MLAFFSPLRNASSDKSSFTLLAPYVSAWTANHIILAVFTADVWLFAFVETLLEREYPGEWFVETALCPILSIKFLVHSEIRKPNRDVITWWLLCNRIQATIPNFAYLGMEMRSHIGAARRKIAFQTHPAWNFTLPIVTLVCHCATLQIGPQALCFHSGMWKIVIMWWSWVLWMFLSLVHPFLHLSEFLYCTVNKEAI